MRFYDIRQFFCRLSNGSCDIVTAIETVNDNIVRSMGTVNIHEGSAFDISHTRTTKDSIEVASMHSNSGITASFPGITTTIDVAANGNLGLHQRCRQAHKQYGG